MARRRATRKNTAGNGVLRRVRVLVLSVCREVREGLCARVESLGVHAPAACDVSTARAMLNESFYDVVLVGDADGESLGASAELAAGDRCVSCVVVSAEPSMEFAVQVMRAGGVDLLGRACTDAEFLASLENAARRSRRLRARARLEERRARKLRELNRSRQSLMGQLGNVCNDMAASYRGLSEQMKQVALASELNTIFRQELDLECLLRTVLEYTLKKVGPTNAAIFLPAQSGDFTLGAYVNYDCPRDTAETLLDHLADIVPHAIEGRDDVAVMRGLTELRGEPGPAGEWLEDSSVAAFSCRVDGECMAAVVLFRDRRTPFNGEAPGTLKIIKELFAQQLSRVVKMNYRHLPKHQWGGFFTDEEDRGMAA
jgi:FixJ family two-component response regulator